MAARNKNSSSRGQGELSTAGKRWWGASACLLGMLLVWSLLQPVDAVSVFQGAATAQNLAWLALATLTTSGCIACGVRYPFASRAWWAIGAGLLWLLVGTVLAGRENNPRVAWYGFWQVISLAACYYSALALLPGPRSQRAALQILLAGCVALALHGLQQVLIEMPLSRAEYLADPEAFLAQDPNLDLPAGSPMRKRFEDRLLHSAEPYATFALTNSLAVLLSGGLVLLCGLAWTVWHDAPRRFSSSPGTSSSAASSPAASSSAALSSSIDSKNASPSPQPARPVQSATATSTWRRWLPRACLGLAILVVGLCWFLTRSRVAYLSVGLVGLVWGLSSVHRLRRQAGLVLGLSTAMGLLLLAAGWWLWHNDRLVFSEAPKSLSYRLEYWLATLAMLRDHAWWGVGLGNFQSYYPLYKLPTASEIVADPHNWPLDLCVSLSLPVGLMLIGWLGLRLLTAVRQAAETQAAGTQAAGEQAAGTQAAGEHAVAERAEARRNSPSAAGALGECHSDELHARLATLDAWSERCLLWGAVIGGTICVGLLSLLSGLEIAVIVSTWLLAAVLIACLRPCMAQLGATSSTLRRTLWLAVAAMLFCLLASGSWQSSGLAVPLLIGLVLASRRRLGWATGPRSTTASQADLGGTANARQLAPRSAKLSRFEHVAIAMLPALGLLCFLVQSWRPTTTSWALMQQALRTPQPRAQLALFEAAAAADRLDTEPLRWQAQLLSSQAMLASSDRFPLLADEVLGALDAWLARDSTKYANWEMAGKHALELAEHARKSGLPPQKWVAAAIGYYSNSVARYPSSIGLNAQLAVVLAVADRWPEAQQRWRLAEQLDQATPHADQKLASQQLWLPILPEAAAAEFVEQQPRIMAEPMLAWLRKHYPD